MIPKPSEPNSKVVVRGLWRNLLAQRTESGLAGLARGVGSGAVKVIGFVGFVDTMSTIMMGTAHAAEPPIRKGIDVENIGYFEIAGCKSYIFEAATRLSVNGQEFSSIEHAYFLASPKEDGTEPTAKDWWIKKAAEDAVDEGEKTLDWVTKWQLGGISERSNTPLPPELVR